MAYLTIPHSPVYEFPYSGAHTSSLPFLNQPANPYPIYPSSNQYGGNATVYHIPGLSKEKRNIGWIDFYSIDYVPLDVILRDLGIDLGSLNRSSSSRNYYGSK